MALQLAIEAFGVRHGGAATVLSDLLEATLQDDHFSRIYVFCSSQSERLFEMPQSDRIVEVRVPFAEANRVYRWWWLEHGLRDALLRLGADVYLSLCGAGLPGVSVPHMTFIQQSLPFSSEAQSSMGLASRLRYKAILGAMKRSCRASRGVIVQTNVMQRMVGDTFRIPSERIHVIPPTVGIFAPGLPSSQLLPMRRAKSGYRLLYVGNDSHYKNVDLLVRAAPALKRRYPEIAIFLTFPLDHPAQRIDGVECLGYLRQPVLSEAYGLADVLVMPSLQETVGLPLVEAMTAGVPVLAADRPYAREVCEDAALYFDPLVESSFMAVVGALMENASLRTNLVAKGIAQSGKRRDGQPYARIVHLLSLAAAQGL
ncbi:MAG: glycosyltransferase family 1 protein [Terriglobia bacterium]